MQANASKCKQTQADDSECKQMIADDSNSSEQNKTKQNKTKQNNSVCDNAHTHAQEIFEKFIIWCRTNAPLSLEFKEPLTLDHFVWLYEKYGCEKVKRCAVALHNKEAYKRNRRAITAWQNFIPKVD